MLICLYFRMYACLSVNIAGAQLPKRHYINIRYKLMAINIDKHRKPVLFSAGTPFLRLFIPDSVFYILVHFVWIRNTIVVMRSKPQMCSRTFYPRKKHCRKRSNKVEETENF